MDYIYDDRPQLSVAQRKKISAEFRKEESNFQPILSNLKNLAASHWGKRWCWLVHEWVTQPGHCELGRRILRCGEVVDSFAEPGLFRCSVLTADRSLISVEITCETMEQEAKNTVLEKLQPDLGLIKELLDGDNSKASGEWLLENGDDVIPGLDRMRWFCECSEFYSECVHVAAALYAFAVYLDQEPLFLFQFQGFSRQDFFNSSPESTDEQPLLSDVFGIEIIDLD